MRCQKGKVTKCDTCGAIAGLSSLVVNAEETGLSVARPTCPECGGIIQFQSACQLCPSCGYSTCG